MCQNTVFKTCGYKNSRFLKEIVMDNPASASVFLFSIIFEDNQAPLNVTSGKACTTNGMDILKPTIMKATDHSFI